MAIVVKSLLVDVHLRLGKRRMATKGNNCFLRMTEHVPTSSWKGSLILFLLFCAFFREMEVNDSILCRCLQAKRYSPWSMASKFLYFPKLSSGSLLALKTDSSRLKPFYPKRLTCRNGIKSASHHKTGIYLSLSRASVRSMYKWFIDFVMERRRRFVCTESIHV